MRYLIFLVLLRQLAFADDLATLTTEDASLQQKARACQRLGERGTHASVPALANLLPDQALNVYARTALERIDSKEAHEAMLAALDKTKGNARLGVIQSLAAMKVTGAEESLAKLLDQEDESLVAAALHALGRLGISEPVIAQFKHASQNRRDLAAAVALQMKDKRLHQAILSHNVSARYHTGAHLKLVLSQEKISESDLANLLQTNASAALLAVRERPSPELANVLHQTLETAKPPLEVGIVHALAFCSNNQTISLLNKALDQREGDTRLPYIETLSKLEAIEALLSRLGDPAIDGALVASASARVNNLLEEKLVAGNDPIPIINILGQRQSPTSIPALMNVAGSEDASVQLAALEALRPTVGFSEVPQLITFYKSTTEDTQKVAFRCLVAASRKAPLAEVGKLLLAEANAAASAETRLPWLRILVTLGYEPTLKSLSLDDTRAINLLAAWPNSQPLENLQALTRNPELKNAAVNVILTLLDKSEDTNARLAVLKSLQPSIHSLTEKRRYLAALGKTKHADAQVLIESFSQDATVSQEVEAARAQWQQN